MSKIIFDNVGERNFQYGIGQVVLYPADGEGDHGYGKGVAWNGITNISESPEGAEPSPVYADGIKYAELTSSEEFKATVEAVTYPDEFAECDGSAEIATGVNVGQQPRKKFCLCYKTTIGNNIDEKAGYVLHIVYNCLAKPTEKAHETVNNDAAEPMSMSWELSTTPVAVTGKNASAHVTIDSTKVPAAKMTAIENALLGSDTVEPGVLFPDEVAALVTD